MTGRDAPGRTPVVAVGLTGDEASRLLDDRESLDRWSTSGAAFGVVGIDRITRTPPADRTAETPRPTDMDPSIVATALATGGGPPLVVAGAAHHDLPYNLARRVLSIDHLTHGRAGLLLGHRDARGHGHSAWGAVGLNDGAELGAATAADTALAIAELWQSWPLDSVIADKDSGVLVRSDRIVRIDHHGVVDIAGPLSVPSSPQGAPVLAWYADDPELVAAAPAAADLVVLGGFPDAASVAAAASGRTGLLVEVPVAGVPRHDEVITAVEESIAAGADGVLLRSAEPAEAAESVLHLLDRALAVLTAVDGTGRGDRDVTLRATLGLAPPAQLLAQAQPAFAAPTTSVYR